MAPAVADAYDARWSPDSRSLVVTRTVRVPSARMVTGWQEQQRVSVADLATGAVRDLGPGTHPQWSGSGRFISFWREGDEDLRVVEGDRIVAFVASTQPEVRWVGDDLYFWHDDEIDVWSAGVVTTAARIAPELAPRYPRDDIAWSADGERFTLTRYSRSGEVRRWIGITATGDVTELSDDTTLFTEWSTAGHTLLLRSAATVALRDDTTTRTATLASFEGRVHGWTSDGRLLMGRVTATVPGGNAFDAFSVWTADGDTETASLPNVFGMRSFSPDGTRFVGVARTGVSSTRLEVYACGSGVTARADTAARRSTVDDDAHRFVRPVAGAITQFLQGSHTGVDLAAPYGSLLLAADDGVVDAVGWIPVGGLRVCVLHADGLESCDYHTALPLVAMGETVARGQPVALIGMTGLTTGAHVHFEAKLNGIIVDPLAR